MKNYLPVFLFLPCGVFCLLGEEIFGFDLEIEVGFENRF